MAFSPYPLLMRGLALPDGPAGRHGRRHGAHGTAKHRQPDATGFRGAAVHSHRVLEAPVRPGRCRTWKHSSGHRGVEFSQIHIPDGPHGLLSHTLVVQMQKCCIYLSQGKMGGSGAKACESSSHSTSRNSSRLLPIHCCRCRPFREFNPTRSTSQPPEALTRIYPHTL